VSAVNQTAKLRNRVISIKSTQMISNYGLHELFDSTSLVLVQVVNISLLTLLCPNSPGFEEDRQDASWKVSKILNQWISMIISLSIPVPVLYTRLMFVKGKCNFVTTDTCVRAKCEVQRERSNGRTRGMMI